MEPQPSNNKLPINQSQTRKSLEMGVVNANKCRYATSMPYPEAIIFDLDGTLIHSAPDLHFAANAALSALGRPPLGLPTITSFIGNGVETLVKRALEATGGVNPALQSEAHKLFLDVYSKNMTTLTRPYAGVENALEEFRSTGISLGICTNKPTQPAKDICEQLDLAKYFDVIIGSELGQPKKPDPAPLKRSIELLGHSTAQAVYIGDSVVDYQTARNALVPFRLFTGGYLNGSLPELADDDRFDNWSSHGILFG